MLPAVILFGSLLALRLVGFLGVDRLSSWRECARYALVIMFLFTGVTHFPSSWTLEFSQGRDRLPHQYLRMTSDDVIRQLTHHLVSQPLV